MRRGFGSVAWGRAVSLSLLISGLAASTAQAELIRVSGSHLRISPSGRTEIYTTEGHIPLPVEQDFNNGQLVLRVYSGLDPEGRGVELLNAESEQLGIIDAGPSAIPLSGEPEQQDFLTDIAPNLIDSASNSLLDGLE